MPRYDFLCAKCRRFLEDEFIEYKDLNSKWPSCCGKPMNNAAMATVQVSPDPYWSGLVHPHLDPSGKTTLVTSRRDFERSLKEQNLYVPSESDRRKPKPTKEQRIKNIQKEQRRTRGTFMDEVNRERRAIQEQTAPPLDKRPPVSIPKEVSLA